MPVELRFKRPLENHCAPKTIIKTISLINIFASIRDFLPINNDFHFVILSQIKTQWVVEEL